MLINDLILVIKVKLQVTVRSALGILSLATSCLTITTPWSNLADDKLVICIFIFFPENRISYFMQIVSIGDNLNEMSSSLL